MITRLPILLAQKQARNNSQKLNNDKLLRQINKTNYLFFVQVKESIKNSI